MSHGLSRRMLRKLFLMAFSHMQQFHHFIQSKQLFEVMHQTTNVSEKHFQQFNNFFFGFLTKYNKLNIAQRVSYPFLTEKNLHELK